jgi:hypothetical protein
MNQFIDINILNDYIVISKICLKTSNHLGYFIFKRLKYNEKCHYRHLTSFNSFFHGKNRKNENENYLYYMQYGFDLLAMFKHGSFFAKTDIERIKTLGVEVCTDLYDFYTKIGYNRKTRKYD